MLDARFTIRQEFCGYSKPRWVARFCERWIGQSQTNDGARRMATRWNRSRLLPGEHPEFPVLPDETFAGVLIAMRAVVSYNWDVEVRDYNAQDECGRENHLYLSLREISDFLDSQGH